MKVFTEYVEYLAGVVAQVAYHGTSSGKDAIVKALDGQPSEVLRSAISIHSQRKIGAFFTGDMLAQEALSSLPKKFSHNAVVVDPACGAGDLLLRASKRLRLSANFEETLNLWGRQIAGTDIHDDFVKTTKIRLFLAAASRSKKSIKLSSLEKILPLLKNESVFANNGIIESATHVLLNPPFSPMNAPLGCRWASGSVNSAAVFLDHCLERANERTHVIAILPDVLRSGSRYENWREHVSSFLDISRIKIYGRFDRQTDVDVFILEGRSLRRSPIPVNWVPVTPRSRTIVGDRFEISIGPVIDFRDPKKGPKHPYLRARDCPAWGILDSMAAYRRFLGKTIKSPFVVIRRTSSPSDPSRAVSTLIRLKVPVLVDNHLIIAKPRDRKVSTCRELVRQLRSKATTEWLNRRIRCRHLTVSSVENIPWNTEV